MHIYIYIYIYIRGFFFTDTDNSHEGRKKEGPSFIPFYHIHLLANIQTYICNFPFEMTATYFNCPTCIYQTATPRDLPPY